MGIMAGPFGVHPALSAYGQDGKQKPLNDPW